MMRTADFLRSVPILAGLADDLLERVAGEVEQQTVRAGEWIMREGEAADRMFIVRTGRLTVIDEGPPATVLRTVRRGDVIGQLALLHEGTRSASVRAHRDSELLALGRDAFEALIRDVPDFALGLMREMGRELARSHRRVAAPPPPRTIAVMGLDAAAPVAEVADGLAAALRQHGSVATLDSGELASIDQALSRRIAGRSVGVVFSGGGARALAQIGVIEELTAAGLQIDRVAGVSLGALVAAMVATGMPSEERYEAFRRHLVEPNPTNDFVPPLYSMLRGAKTRRLLHEALGDRRIEELPLRYFCLSCDLVAREAVVHRRGPLADAVYASLAIPGVFPPVATDDGRLLVDGGVLDNLPVETMAATGEGPVIAVDVTGRTSQLPRTPRPRLARLGRPLRRALTGGEAEIPRLGETLVRTLTVGSIDTVAAARLHADLVITPRVDGVGLVEWKALDRVRELGRQAAREVLAAGVGPDLSHVRPPER